MHEPIRIPAYMFEDFLKDVERLNKKAAKLGVGDIEFSFEAEQIEKTTKATGTKYMLDVVDITITTPPIRFAGWEFVATVEPVGEYNTVRTMPDVEIPEEYRKTDLHCDHCGYDRQRKQVYVLKHEDGRYTQVGSTCIRDFLGGHSAEYFANLYASLFQFIESLGEPLDDEDFYGGARTGCYELQALQFLTTAAFCYRCVGWKSRGQAYEDDTHDATADTAIYFLTAKDKTLRRFKDTLVYEPTEEDEAKAAEVQAWLRSDRFDPDVRNLNDYEWNLMAVGAADYVSWKNLGILASAQASMERQQEWDKERKAKELAATGGKESAYVGEVKKRMTLTLNVELYRTFETDYGMTTLFIMRDSDGNKFAWFSTSAPSWEVGDTITMKGTVKKHEIDRYGTKQTVLNRCKEVTK